eukprot:c16724_g1_i2.p1 GENE.c16724_g1_i2~~c16724_g1_i2.p1  ORF type:complete len:338 (+),score=119.61 c16724_g1_i2:40-1014(+)
MHSQKTFLAFLVRPTNFKSFQYRLASTVVQSGNLIDGKKIAEVIRMEIKKDVEDLKTKYGITPGIATVIVGQRKDSESYVNAKGKAAIEAGMYSKKVKLNEDVSQSALLDVINQLNTDDKIHGILVQLPLPDHINSEVILSTINVTKDVDGFSAENIGRLCLKKGHPFAIPCTPLGCMELLKRSGINPSGKHAVVLGRSDIVGMPMANLLIKSDATVTVCHSKTENLEEHMKRADIVIAALGKPEFVRGSWLKEGCVVIDVGINSVPDKTSSKGYKLVGDVNFEEAKQVASKITPVPGGVGPMTIAMLLNNTLNLAKATINRKN